MAENGFKRVMRYSRTYKYVKLNTLRTVMLLVCFVTPLTIAWVYFCPWITNCITLIAKGTLEMGFSDEIFEIGMASFSTGPIYYLVTSGHLPGVSFIWINFVVTLCLLSCLTLFVKAKPVTIFLCITFFVHLCACLFFLLWPEWFPYGVAEYSELYMKQQMGIFICMSMVMGLVTTLLPMPWYKVILAVLGCCAYSFVFAITRYVTFIFILKRFSVLYMAGLFFTFGPLIDFLYMVAIYSIVADRTSTAMEKNMEVWEW